MKRAALAAILALTVAPAALAEKVATAPQPTAPAIAAPSITGDQVTGPAQTAQSITDPSVAPTDPSTEKSRLALAHQLIDLDGGEQQVAQQVDTLYAMMFTKMAEKMSSDGKPVLVATQVALQQQMRSLIRPMLDATAEVYAKNYTEQQLRDIIAFRQSPTGQAMADKSQAIQQQAVAAMLPLLIQDMPRVMHSTVDAVCKAETCSPEMRAQLSAAMRAALNGGEGPEDGPAGVTVS